MNKKHPRFEDGFYKCRCGSYRISYTIKAGLGKHHCCILLYLKMKTLKELFEAAKTIQSHLEKFAGEYGGARVWREDQSDLLSVCIWSDKFKDLSQTEKVTTIVDQIYLLPEEIISTISFSHIYKMTPAEYKMRRFLETPPPFCRME